ncbi:hypothetical protein HBB16_03225 [Pseudonocardia sp. MCCB 268]|nr:hypothetical protein [Pseudonocardia cytotoxica]
MRTRCSPPDPGPTGRPRPRTGGPTRSPTPSGSSGTCRTSWSRRSAPRWRRPPRPTCSCTSPTAPDALLINQIAVRQVLFRGRSARVERHDAGAARDQQRLTSPVTCAGPVAASLSRRRCSCPRTTVAASGSLRQRIAERLPRPEYEVDLLPPLHRGALRPGCTIEGESAEEHTGDGTRSGPVNPSWRGGAAVRRRTRATAEMPVARRGIDPLAPADDPRHGMARQDRCSMPLPRAVVRYLVLWSRWVGSLAEPILVPGRRPLPRRAARRPVRAPPCS